MLAFIRPLFEDFETGFPPLDAGSFPCATSSALMFLNSYTTYDSAATVGGLETNAT